MQQHISEETFKAFEDRKRARFINSLSGFKSANLLGSIDSKGNTNLSILSSAFHLGASPALLGFIIRPDVSPRHTLDNIRETKVLTLNHVNENIWKSAHQTSARYDKETSEFSACNLTPEYLNDFQAPFVKESHIKVALEFVREIKIEENGTHMIIAKVLDVYLPQETLQEDGYIDIEEAQSVTVSGLDSYHTTTRKARLSYAKVDKEVSEL